MPKALSLYERAPNVNPHPVFYHRQITWAGNTGYFLVNT